MDAQKMNFDGILQSVMQNPEMLKGALSLAQTLSSSGALNGLFSQSDAEEAPKEAPKETPTIQSEEPRACVAVSGANHRKDTMRHRKLIEALCLYVSEEKREKLGLLLRLLEWMELAEGFKR